MTINMAPLSHGFDITSDAEERGAAVEAAIVIGHHPALAIASQHRAERGAFELDVRGRLLGEAVNVVRAETVDVPVPAEAEIVVQGRIICDAREQDGPFGDYWLYYCCA